MILSCKNTQSEKSIAQISHVRYLMYLFGHVRRYVVDEPASHVAVPRDRPRLLLPQSVHHRRHQRRRLGYRRRPEVGQDRSILQVHHIWLVVSTPLKNISQNGNLPQIGVKRKNL